MVEMSEALGLEALRGQSADALQPVSRMVRVFISSTHSGKASTAFSPLKSDFFTHTCVQKCMHVI